MSANRAVQSAQRRRSGPPEPGVPGSSRGPQPSINSAQMFARQGNMPTGRLAGQQAAMQQKQMQQEQMQQGGQSVNNITKMSIPQAITLITLRLGALESKLLKSDGSALVSQEDNGIITTILTRLDALEQGGEGEGAVSSENPLLKQQIDIIKQTVIKSGKENASIKSQLAELKKELTQTKDLLVNLQNLTIENSQKILELSSSIPDYDVDANEEIIEVIEEEEQEPEV